MVFPLTEKMETICETELSPQLLEKMDLQLMKPSEFLKGVTKEHGFESLYGEFEERFGGSSVKSDL